MAEITAVQIACRSHASRACYHGRDAGPIYGYPALEPDVRAVAEAYESDGTFDGGTVICDACYIAIGQPLRGEPRFITG